MNRARGLGPPSRLERMIWGEPDRPSGPLAAGGMRVVRTVTSLVRDLVAGQLTLRAMSLVYTTLLSIVPLLALSFSVLKAFGVADQIHPLLLNFLQPLGEKGAEIAQRIVSFIENMNVGVLGALGLALLLYTAVSLVQKIEESLNFIWHVPRARPFGERFSRYLSVLLVGPILIFSALGLTATVMNIDMVREAMSVGTIGRLVEEIGKLVPYALVIAAFTFVYLFIPNAKVRVLPALAGGAVGGIGWQSAGWAFATFVASSGKYAAIYSGFAILVLFMIWLYVSWLVLLFGASVAFYVQCPEYLYARGGEPRLSNRLRERLALAVVARVAKAFSIGETSPTPAGLMRELGVPGHALQTVLDALERQRIVTRNGDEPPGYLPARDPATVPLTEVLETVRAAGEEGFLTPASMPATQSVDEVLERMRDALASSMEGRTMADLARSPDAPEPTLWPAQGPEVPGTGDVAASDAGSRASRRASISSGEDLTVEPQPPPAGG